MRGPLGFLAALRSDGNDDQNRPAANVGAAFLVAAAVVAVVGFKWLGSDGEPTDSIADGWALGTSSESAGASTTIPPTPAAIAVRLGIETTSASDEVGDRPTTPTTRPGTTPTTRPGTQSASPGSTGGGSGTTSGTDDPGGTGSTSPHPTNTVTSSPETTTTTEATTTTEETTTTESTEPPLDPQAFDSPDDAKLLKGLGEAVGDLFG